MDLAEFADLVSLYDKTYTEVDKARLIGFFKLRVEGVDEFTVKEIGLAFEYLHLSQPNLSRLKKKLNSKAGFIRGSKSDSFKLKATVLKELDECYPDLNTSEEIKSLDTVLPSALYEGAYGYIVTLAKQINASYENNIFDGCAVLMRRLLEVLLILTYRNLGIDSQIKDGDGNYYLLERILNDAVKNPKLSLSRNVKQHVEVFRKLGNFSAHRIEYSCKKQYIVEILLEYRATIEELTYKAGLK